MWIRIPTARQARYVIALVALCALTWLWLSRFKAVPGEEAPAAADAEAPASHSSQLTAESLAPVSVESGSRTLAARPSNEPVTSPSPVLGTITVVDDQLTEYAEESGWLTVSAMTAAGTSVDSLDIPVTRGTWDPNLIPAPRATLRRIVLRDREAVLEEARGLPLDAGKPQQLRAIWLADVRLHVVDSTTHQELDGLTLFRVDNIHSFGVTLPVGVPGVENVGRDFSSPVTLAPVSPSRFHGSYKLFAWRSSYAWGAITIDQTGGGDLFLKLDPGGDVRFQLTGGTPTADMTIRLWKDDSRTDQLAERPARPNVSSTALELEVQGLAVGDYWVTLEKGVKESANVLDASALRIAPRSSTVVALDVPDQKPDATIEAIVVVRLDPSWDLPSFSVAVTDLDLPVNATGRERRLPSERMTSNGDGLFSSKPMKFRAGRYSLELVEARFAVECLLDELGPREMLLTLPPRCSVGVTVLDGETGSLVERPTLCWTAMTSSADRIRSLCVGVPATGAGRFEFFAPAGKIRIETSGQSIEPYLLDSRVLELSPSTALEVVVHLQVGRRVVIALREGERRVDWSADAMSGFKIRAAGEPVIIRRSSLDTGSGKMTCLLPDRGRYTISFPTLAGYVPIPDQVVDLTAVATVEIAVQLVRQ